MGSSWLGQEMGWSPDNSPVPGPGRGELRWEMKLGRLVVSERAGLETVPRA